MGRRAENFLIQLCLCTWIWPIALLSSSLQLCQYTLVLSCSPLNYCSPELHACLLTHTKLCQCFSVLALQPSYAFLLRVAQLMAQSQTCSHPTPSAPEQTGPCDANLGRSFQSRVEWASCLHSYPLRDKQSKGKCKARLGYCSKGISPRVTYIWWWVALGLWLQLCQCAGVQNQAFAPSCLLRTPLSTSLL